jgi:diguanylate cyclase (GGDEF)-like protein
MSASLIDSVADTTAHRDRDDLNQAVARLLLHFLDAHSVVMYRLVDDVAGRRVMPRLHMVRDQGQFVSVQCAEQDARSLNDVQAWKDSIANHAATQYSLEQGTVCSVFPLQGERDVIGLLEICTAASLEPRNAELVSGILRILRNQLALLDYGERDALTGLLNRKTLEATFGKVLQRTDADLAAKREPAWLGVVDIDKFKSINDSHGHLFGDEVLLLVAQLMKQSFRGADQLFRFGGEEFVIVLAQANTEGARIAFERLRVAIESYRFPQIGKVTISLGYTQVDPLEGPSSCIERADAALYYAKHHGRNNVRHYEALVASGELTPINKADDIELF